MTQEHLPGIDEVVYGYRGQLPEPWWIPSGGPTDLSILQDEVRRLADEVERLRRLIEART